MGRLCSGWPQFASHCLVPPSLVRCYTLLVSLCGLWRAFLLPGISMNSTAATVVRENGDRHGHTTIHPPNQALHVTMLSPVNAPAPAPADPPPASPDPSRSAVPVVDVEERVPMDAGDVGVEPGELAVDAELPEIEPRVVDFGGGIVVGEVSVDDFKVILSFPKLDADIW